MFSKVDHVILFVTDMNRAVSFYKDIMGFKIGHSSPDFTRVETENIWIGLHSTENAGIDIGSGPLVYFTANEIEKAVAHFKMHEVRMGNMQTVPTGKIQTFFDTEGNALGLYAANAR